MLQSLRRLSISAALTILLSLPVGIRAQEKPSAASATIKLIDALKKNQVYLFDTDEKSALNRIHKQLRKAPDKRETIEKKLFELLDKSPKLLEVSFISGRAVLADTKPIKLPGDTGTVIIRIGDKTACDNVITTDYDLAQSRSPIPLHAPKKSTTWAILHLVNVPAGINSLIIEFTRGHNKIIRPLIIEVQAPKPAKLKVSVLSADTGKPVPAMIYLTWKLDGKDRKPTNVVDFSSQFDNLGRASNQRHATLPGKLKGYLWWCIPGPFDMPIPPGKWEIAIRRGLEHVPIFDSFTAEHGQNIEKTYTPRHWANMPKLGWYSGDDHVHCQIANNRDAERLMKWAQAEDVHLVNVLKMSDVYRTWFQQRGFGPAYRVIDGDYILAPGQECPRTHSAGFGHTVSINTTSYVRNVDKYWLYDWVADRVHAQGGMFGYAHALLTHPYIRRGMSLSLPKHKVDFAEILQYAEMGTDFFYDFLNMGFKLTASAGTDVPWQGTIGEVRMYAYIGDKPFSADAWFDAVKRGQTFVTNGPMIEFHVDNAMPGDEIVTEKPRKLRVKARTWGDPERMVPTKLEIVKHGDVIKSIAPAGKNKTDLSLDFELESGNGFWIAARADGSDGSKAHTTPVYVTRKPLRFWKYHTIDELIAARMENLKDVEKLLERAIKIDKAPTHERLGLKLMVRQTPELQQRVSDARQFYEKLKQIADSERTMRSKSK